MIQRRACITNLNRCRKGEERARARRQETNIPRISHIASLTDTGSSGCQSGLQYIGNLNVAHRRRAVGIGHRERKSDTTSINRIRIIHRHCQRQINRRDLDGE